jgi:GNAT superfamily N-acetyltransferase
VARVAQQLNGVAVAPRAAIIQRAVASAAGVLDTLEDCCRRMRQRSHPTINVRRAAEPEHTALESLMFAASIAVEAQREALLANPGVIRFPAEQIADGRVYVAECDGQIVGFSTVLPRDDGNAELEGLFVRPDMWRTGVGTRLIEAAEAMAARWGAGTLNVVANRHAELFYRACGFERIGEQRTLFDVALLMKKRITATRRG